MGYLDVSDSSQSSPNAWTTTHTTVRPCKSLQITSVILCSILAVCGRIIAYQFGGPDGFSPAVTKNIDLDSWYIDGVSLTHSLPGSRTHNMVIC